jgi:hypothetical protein
VVADSSQARLCLEDSEVLAAVFKNLTMFDQLARAIDQTADSIMITDSRGSLNT